VVSSNDDDDDGHAVDEDDGDDDDDDDDEADDEDDDDEADDDEMVIEYFSFGHRLSSTVTTKARTNTRGGHMNYRCALIGASNSAPFNIAPEYHLFWPH